jgi:hypothetical protein
MKRREVKSMNFDQLSDEIMGPVLDNMPSEEQRKLLLLLRRITPERAHAWIDKQFKVRRLESAPQIAANK